MITKEQLRGLQHLLNLADDVRVTQIKTENDVYRIEAGADVFFLKTYTKPWYGSDVARTSFNANHEACAWTILAQHELPAPKVIYVAADCGNPLARPFVVTRQVPGTPFTTLLLSATNDQRSALLSTVGAYLRHMHAITFPFAGYLTTLNGPAAPPDPSNWQHRCWTAQARQNDALTYLDQARNDLLATTYKQAYMRCTNIADQLAAAYHPPRFTHGDCHAHQFFLTQEAGQWQVTGVVDMEVASAGDCVEDVLKISIELAQTLPYEPQWWEALFAGYGGAPDLRLFQLRLLGVTLPELHGSGSWTGGATYDQVLRRVLVALDWSTLFHPIME